MEVSVRKTLFGLFLFVLISSIGAQDETLPSNQGFVTIQEIMIQSCAACHVWAGSHEGLTDPVRVTPQDPGASSLYLLVEADAMPMGDNKLTLEQKNLIKHWIAGGASASDEPITVVQAEEPIAAAQADEAQPQVTASESRTIVADAVDYEALGKRINTHMISGFASSALLIAAGTVGTIHFLSMMDQGHEGEDVDAGDLPDEVENEHAGQVRNIWGSSAEQALRWTHVGLLVAGEALYLYNAVSGLTFPPEKTAGITPRKIHRWSFYTHAALMTTNAVMGFLTTSVLSRGSHNEVHNFAVAHAVIGFAVPAVILTSGVAMVLAR